MANQNFKVKKGLEVGTGVTISGVDGNINISGIITAQFKGDGSQLTGVTASGTGVVVQEEGSSIGTATTINFIGSNVTAALSSGIANVTVSGGSGGLSNVVEDTTPQLGGNLDLNGKNITGIGSISITGGFNATGVSTFQENVVFQSTASFGDNDKINVGAGNDLQIFHDGTSNIIKDAVGVGISLVGNTKVVGVITATSFSGSLATTDLTGTITNAQLAGSIADGKLASTFLKNVVEDTTPQLGGNLDLNGKDITGTGDINITGVSTFVGNVNLLSDSGKFIAGAGGDLEIFHDGNDSGIRNNTGGLYLQNDGTIFIGDVGANEYSAKFHDNGATELYYDGTKKFETTSAGVTVTGTLAATAVTGSGSGLTSLTGASAGTYGASTNTPVITVDSNGRITGISTVATSGAGGGGGISNIVEDNTPQLGGNLDLNSKTINGTGNIDITGYAAVSGVSTFSGVAGFSSHITLSDYAEIQIGSATGGDLKIYHDASHSYISDEGTGNLKFRSNAFKFTNVAENKTSMVVTPPGAVELYHDNALRLKTTDTGVNVTDNLRVAGISTFVGNVNLLSDSAKFIAGAGSDLEIYHNGSSSYIDNATGDLFIRGAGGSSIKLQSPSGEDSVIADANGGVKLYYDNAKKLETVNAGVTVTGTLAATAVTGDGSGLTNLPASGITTAVTNVQVTYNITASGNNYRVTGPGYDASENNPDIYLVRGQRYRFINATGSSHPFAIRSSPGGSAYTDGVSGDQDGTQDFNVQNDAPVRLYYQCTIHSGMVGNIYIVGGSDWRMTDVNTSTAPDIFTTRNVGIGTETPSQLLEIRGVEPRICLNGTTDDNEKGIEFEHLGQRRGSIFHNAGDGNLTISSGDNGTGYFINFKTDNSERLRITSDGRVNIGTTTEGHASADDLTIATSGNTGITIRSGTSSQGSLYFSDATSGGGEYAGWIRYDHSGNNLTLGTGESERLRITSAGRVNIGGASDVDHTLCVAGTDNTTGLTGGHNQGIQLQNKSTTDGTYSQIEWRTADGGRCARIAGIQTNADGNGGELAFLTENSSGSTVEALRIDHRGHVMTPYSTTSKVGINFSPTYINAGPSYNLHVQGDFYAREIQTAYKTRLTGSLIMDGDNDSQNTSLGGVKGIDIRMLGMYRRFSTQPVSDWTPNFQHNQSDIDSVTNPGDTFTATIIVKQRSAGSPNGVTVSGVQVDGTSTGVDLDWVGGSAPGASPGSGWDVWTFVVMKTSSTPTYHVLGKRETYS